MTRRELTDELTAGLGGARHEARFIVDEVFGPTACPGVSPGADEVPAGALSGGARHGRAPGGGRAAAVRLRALAVPPPRPLRRPPRADPAPRDRAGRRGGAGRGPAPAPAGRLRPRPRQPGRPRRRRRRDGERGHRARPGERAGSGPPARGLGHRRQCRRPRRGRDQRGGASGVVRRAAVFPVSSSPRGAGSRRCRRGRGARSTSSSPTRRTCPRANGPGWRPRCARSRAGPSSPVRGATARPGWPTWRRCWRSAGSGWGDRAAPSSSWHPTRPSPRRGSRAVSATTRSGSSPTSRGGHAPWSYGPAADGVRRPGSGRRRGRPRGWGRRGSPAPSSAGGHRSGRGGRRSGSGFDHRRAGGGRLQPRRARRLTRGRGATGGIGGRPRRAPLRGRPR